MYIIKSEKGYWNKENGWVEDKENATYFETKEKESYQLPKEAKITGWWVEIA